jgi:AraC-like DNA-binding protein
MLLNFEDRESDSPLVEKIWRSHSDRAGRFLSVAASNVEMAVTRHRGKIFLTVRGPETSVTPADCPAEGEWVGIRFKLGTFLPLFLPGTLRDRQDVTLPAAASGSFWLNGSAWAFPDFENADTFVDRLVRKGLLTHDYAIDDALQRRREGLSTRTTQRRFLQATGITHAAVRQIQRARYATTRLRQGASILDTVYDAGYFDQPHLTRSLRRLIGQTPAEVMRADEQLSFLYKTSPLP